MGTTPHLCQWNTKSINCAVLQTVPETRECWSVSLPSCCPSDYVAAVSATKHPVRPAAVRDLWGRRGGRSDAVIAGRIARVSASSQQVTCCVCLPLSQVREFDTGISVVRLMRERESQSLPLPCTRHNFSPALGDLWVSQGWVWPQQRKLIWSCWAWLWVSIDQRRVSLRDARTGPSSPASSNQMSLSQLWHRYPCTRKRETQRMEKQKNLLLWLASWLFPKESGSCLQRSCLVSQGIRI